MDKASSDLNQEPVSKTLPISVTREAMNEIVPIANRAISGQSVQTADARELHAFLEVKTRFNDWIAARIVAYGFVEGIDFAVTENKVTTESNTYSGVKMRIDYHLTIGMAKELAMVERNEKGRQARRYFLECERRAKAAQVPVATIRRNVVRRSKEELALARAEVERVTQMMRADVARAQAETARIVQESAMATATGYADMLQHTLKMDINAAFLAGCNAAKAVHGVDIRATTAITHIESESQQVWYTPTDLGKMENGLSGMKINQMLETAGLQTKPDGKQWVPTESGKKYSRIFDTSKKHNSGTLVPQVKWSKDVLQKMGSAA
jgi:anti-repressor protein